MNDEPQDNVEDTGFSVTRDNAEGIDTFSEDTWPEDHRSGVVTVVGRPNVGKSTLINTILGQKIAIVSPKPQTTRKRQIGIYTVEHGQMLLADTPGIHQPFHKLGEYMVRVAKDSLRDADIILWILDASAPPNDEDRHIAELITTVRGETPVVLALNKCDLIPGDRDLSAHLGLVEHQHAARISAQIGDGVEALTAYLLEQLPLGPRYFPVDQLSEVNMRYIAAEVVREKVILNTEKEIPHAVAVEIDSYREEDDRTTISAIIYVERDSQKGIVVGKGGSMIKRIGTQARRELRDMQGGPVHLDLRVKVMKNWRQNVDLARRLGYSISRDDED